jgi:uncharacterized protein
VPRPASPALDALLARAAHDPDVAAVLLYGSAARGEPSPRDTDVAIVQAPGSRLDPFDLRLRYAPEDERLDVQVFQDLPLHVRVRVLRDASPLLVRDEDATYEAAFAALREWDSFRPFVEAYLEGAGRA